MNHKEITGRVVSVKMNKTVVVAVSHLVRHPIYKKAVTRVVTFSVHNEVPEIGVGDMVAIEQTRPISKTKHFKLVRKVQV